VKLKTSKKLNDIKLWTRIGFKENFILTP